MELIDDYLEENAQRERALTYNMLLDDGKWMFPIHKTQKVVEIDITKQLKEMDNWFIHKSGKDMEKKR